MSSENKFDLKSLRAPFPSSRISWRIGRAGKNGEKIWVKALAYFDARDGMDRLDEVVGPENWQDEYRKDGAAVIARIGILINGVWVWKEGTSEETEIEAVKGGESGAFKRACVKWGIGRYLYDLTEAFATVCDQNAPGAVYARTSELGQFYWQPPKLPEFALPENERGQANQNNVVALPPQGNGMQGMAVGEPGAYVMTFGKFNGQRLDAIDIYGLNSYLDFLKKSEKKTPSGNAAITAIEAFLATRTPKAK